MKLNVLVLSCLILAIPCDAETIVVDPNGFFDFTTIQAAIDYSWNGDTVVVRSGTYVEDIYFIGRAIELRSTEPEIQSTVEATIITGRITFEFGEGNDSIVNGFSILGWIRCNESSPSISNNIITNSGIGIYGSQNAEPEILNNTISDCGIYFCHGLIEGNHINNSGGAGLSNCGGRIANNLIENSSDGGISSCSGLIENNTISGNSTNYNGGGGLTDCSGTVRYNTIVNNTASGLNGGGLYNCDGDISHNLIQGNSAKYGGGLSECDGNVTSNKIIENNSSYDGGGLHMCQGTIANNIIKGNSAGSGYSGGGLSICNGDIFNNSIVGNTADRGSAGDALYANIFKNNIIAFNYAWVDHGGAFTGSYDEGYNCYWGNVNGNFYFDSHGQPTDFAIDPLFEDYVNNDLHLKSEYGRWHTATEQWVIDSVTSRCIDAGDPADDIDKEPNPNGARINVGAYGGTIYASKSPNGDGPEPEPECVDRPSKDYNNDCRVDLRDFAEFLSEWLACGLDIQEACWE